MPENNNGVSGFDTTADRLNKSPNQISGASFSGIPSSDSDVSSSASEASHAFDELKRPKWMPTTPETIRDEGASTDGFSKKIPIFHKDYKLLSILGLAAAVFVLVSVILSIYTATTFIKPSHVFLSADTAVITPSVSGHLSQWNVKTGDSVTAGQSLGNVDTGSAIDSAQVDLNHLSDSASFAKAKAEIKSPIDGRVLHSDAILDTEVSPQSQLAVIADTERMYALAYVTVEQSLKLKPGQYVSLTISGYGSRTFGGYVQSVGRSTQAGLSSLLGDTPQNAYSDPSATAQFVSVKISIVNTDRLPLVFGDEATAKIFIDSQH